jgi:SAM-dependent methyltransferase
MAAPRRFRCRHCGGEATLGVNCESASACSSCHAIFRVDGGIVALADTIDDRDYPERLVDLVANVEGRHFWFAARNDVILSTMRRVVGPVAGLRLLDIGCGTGFVTAALEAAGMDAWGVDMHRVALRHARARVRGPLFSGHTTALPFFRDFDVASLFDVIEHIDDDAGALANAATVLRPNGFVVATVPAGPNLWTAYDAVIGHKRRYDRQRLTSVLRQARLEVRYIGYFSCLPLLAQIAQRWISPELRSDTGDSIAIVEKALRIPPEPINSLLRWSMRAEAPLRRLSWVRGGSLIVIGERLE